MSDTVKIVTIGGGSSYTPELIEGFINRMATLPVRELWLVDVPQGEEKLNVIASLARRMAKKANVPMEIYTTLERRKALEGADFVTTQFRVGQLDAREKDELIPAKYGVIGQETNGPGGLLKALRTIPVLLDIIKDCEELCPDAWLISFTNPSGLNAEAIHRYTGWKRCIGLCNSPIGITNRIARLLEVDRKDIRMDFVGLNHMVFGVKTFLKGVDVSQTVIEKLAAYNEGKTFDEGFDTIPYLPAFIRALGVVPGPYLRYYFSRQAMLAHAMQEAEGGKSRAQVVKQVERDLFAQYANQHLDVKPPELEKRGGAFYSEAACNLIDSIYNNTGDIQVVNTVNNGACASFAADEIIEASCVITKEGPRPLTFGRLPLQIEGLCRQIKSFEVLAAEAAVTGNYDTALLALTINPLVGDEGLANTILQEMLSAHRDYLPTFEHLFA